MDEDILWDNFTSSGDSFSDFMVDIEGHLSNLVKQSAKIPETFNDNFKAFTAAIDWTEQWIISLLTFHVVLFLLVITTRTRITFQSIIFFIICLFIGLSERINSYLSSHWREFAKQDYFDKHGVFISIMFSGPLLVIAFIQLINFLIQTSSLLIKVKRMELKKRREDNAKKES